VKPLAAEAPWREQVVAAYPDPALFALSGIEQLRAFLDGRAPKPPIGHLTGMDLTDVGLGTAAFSMPASRWLLSPQGLISAGTLAILADGPLGCAVQSALPPATAYATSELSLRVLRPVRAGGTLVARGSLVHASRSLALSTVQIVDDSGRLLADGSSLCFVMPPSPSSSRQPAAPPADIPDEHNRYGPFERPELGEVIAQGVWERMGGFEVLRSQLAGDLPFPPIHFLTGAGPVEVGEGLADFSMPCHEWLCSPLRTVEGGTIAMLADHALSSAIQTTVPLGASFGSIDLKVNFLRPVHPDGRQLLARGRVRHAGRMIVVAESEVVNADGKTVAFATGSAMILRDRPASLRNLPEASRHGRAGESNPST
jgi:uncharacterized protein (TIGR00369 family)